MGQGILCCSCFAICILIYVRIEQILTCVCGSNRGLLHLPKTFNCFVVLSCTIFCLAAYGLCSRSWVQNPQECDVFESFGKSYNVEFSDTGVGDTVFDYAFPPIHNSFENVCPDTHSFCFSSTLSGFIHKERSLKEASVGDSRSQYDGPFCVGLAQGSKQASNKSSSADHGIFKLLSGGVVSCSLNSREGVNDVPSLQTEGFHKDGISIRGVSLLKQRTTHSRSKNSEMSKSSSFEGSFTPNVRIDPTVLDWGQKYLYSPSVAFLTVLNSCNDSVLHLYEPFSNDLQFYPCNFSEVSLGPGESVLICFVFFPRCLGLSSAHLILQTSSGGLIIEAKGYAFESPFGIRPLIDLEISPGGRLSKNFSSLNPLDETLYVEEITAWISVSLGHNSAEIEAICGINNSEVFDNLLFPTIKDCLVVKSSQIGSPIVTIKPHRNWEIGPHSSESLMDIDLTVGFEGKIFGALCLHLVRSSKECFDTIMVPIEAEMDSHFVYDIAGIFVSATLEGLTACDGGETAITISLRNYAPCVLSFVTVVEVAESELFHIKYVEGLLLFPSTVTQVGIINCSHLRMNLHDMPPKVSNMLENCKLVIITNDSTSPQIEIPCEDVLHVCFEYQKLSSVVVENKSGNMRARYVIASKRLPPNVKVIDTADVDELVLGNWLSQGTNGGMSVLEDHEVLFPMVQVGSHLSRWITLKNPSQHPVMMQLILNSGEIIDECRDPDDLSHPFSSGNLVLDVTSTPTKYGFSVPESAVTEAYVHPYDYATLGPIIFYPSKRCRWNGSALIRNNLSGVERIPLRGFGGLLSLVLLERSEHVKSINFDLKMHKPLNLSLPDALLHMKETTSPCSEPLAKELYAKNTGDLPLEVKTMTFCGRECGLGGFKIHACKGFALEPGESTKLLISYQTDFSAAIVHQDLELALATGVFVIPMKASIPYEVLYYCKKSMFWMRVKKSFLGFLLFASLIFLVFCFILPQTMPLCSSDYLSNSYDNSDHTASEHAGKMNDMLCSDGEDITSTKEVTCDTSCYGQGEHSEQETSQHLQASENSEHISHLLDTQNEGKLPSTDTMKAPQQDNPTVRTGKGKGRRRKRKSQGGRVEASSEASSSQIGNSTPSSPVATASNICSWPLSPIVEQPQQHSDNCQASASAAKTNILEAEVSVECCNNSVPSPQVLDSVSPSDASSIPSEIPSATFTLPDGPSSSSLVSTSNLSLHVQAPIPELEDQYEYDVWGGHLSGLHLLSPNDVTRVKSIPAEENFESFYAWSPDALMKNSQGE